MKNFEKYKTAEEREQAYAEFCRKYTELGFCKSCPLKSADDKPRFCTFYWLELEADEEKPMDCPFCGMTVDTIELTDGYICACDNLDCCCYRSAIKNTKVEAIAAHNRVCKAVAAYKEGEVK